MNTSALLSLYQATSKHSQYQALPPALQGLFGDVAVEANSRHEAARWAYVSSKVDLAGLRVADIGGNTGYFSFEALERGARSVHYFEGNTSHHDFVAAAAAELGLGSKLLTSNRYVQFPDDVLPPFDCVLLLNVLHHVGDDFGEPRLSLDHARGVILGSLQTLSHSTDWLVFQLGFNWKGDRDLPIFQSGTKAEMVDFVTEGTRGHWNIVAIGAAEGDRAAPVFRDIGASNAGRIDALGEFLNRPLFIMRSRNKADS